MPSPPSHAATSHGDTGTVAGVDQPRRAPNRRRAIGTLAGVTGLAWTAPAILSADTAAAATGCVLCGTNLVSCPGGPGLVAPGCFEGDPAEDPNPPAITGVTPVLKDPPWSVTNGLRVCDYGHTQMPTTTDLTPLLPAGSVGPNLFCGSFSSGLSPAQAEQTYTFTQCLALIDTGTLGYTLSAYLGGNPSVPTTAELTATFLPATGTTPLGSAALPTSGPLASTTLALTGLVQYATSGTLPAGTRRVRFTLTFAYPEPVPLRNTACADLLSFEVC